MIDPKLEKRLKREMMSPYRGLRQFIYFGMGASGFIGGFICFCQLLAGRNVESTLPNLVIQVGLVILMVVLWKWELRGTQAEKQDY